MKIFQKRERDNWKFSKGKKERRRGEKISLFTYPRIFFLSTFHRSPMRCSYANNDTSLTGALLPLRKHGPPPLPLFCFYATSSGGYRRPSDVAASEPTDKGPGWHAPSENLSSFQKKKNENGSRIIVSISKRSGCSPIYGWNRLIQIDL